MSATRQQSGTETAQRGTAEASSARSRTTFPYSDLSAAVELARAIHKNYGHGCDLAQLAGQLGSTVTSSTFRSHVSAAKLFGLIERRSKSATLTDRGAAILDPQRRDTAKVEAFLAVPLYRSLFDDFDGKLLPPGAGLESAMLELGVTAKSVSRARQVFQRSADAAGFFRMGRDRLVRPPSAPTNDSAPSQDEERSDERPNDAEDGVADVTADPLLRGVWSKLPATGPFPSAQREQWLALAKLAIDVAYGPDPQDDLTSETDDHNSTPGSGV